MKILKKIAVRCGSMLLAAALLMNLIPASVLKASAYTLDAVEISPGLTISANDNFDNNDEADYAEWNATTGEFNFHIESGAGCYANHLSVQLKNTFDTTLTVSFDYEADRYSLFGGNYTGAGITENGKIYSSSTSSALEDIEQMHTDGSCSVILTAGTSFTIYLDPSSDNSGPDATAKLSNFVVTGNTFNVTWKNDDGTVLETDEDVVYNTTPEYNGATPTKAATELYTYTFDKWSPEIAAVTGDVTYTATYTTTVNDINRAADVNYTYTPKVDPSYIVTIPSSITLSDTEDTPAEIEVEDVTLNAGQSVVVKLEKASNTTSGSTFSAKNGESVANYTIKSGTTDVAIGDTVAEFTADGTQALTFSKASGATVAGKHSETLTFNISVATNTKVLNIPISGTTNNLTINYAEGQKWTDVCTIIDSEHTNEFIEQVNNGTANGYAAGWYIVEGFVLYWTGTLEELYGIFDYDTHSAINPTSEISASVNYIADII